MRDEGVNVFDQKMNNKIFYIYAQMNEPLQAFAHLQEMRRNKVNLSEEVFIANYNALINIFCKLSRNKDIMTVFNDMIAEGLKPNNVTYNTLV